MEGQTGNTATNPEQLGPTPEGTTGNNDSAPDLAQEIAKIKEQYSASSREAHRLNDELKQERDARIRLESSLKSKEVSQESRFPSRESFVKARVEMGVDDRLAAVQWEEAKINYDNQMFLHKQLQATQNMVRFQSESQERAFQETNPDAQKAKAFFQDIPEMAALPVADQIKRHKEIVAKVTPRTEGRDTTALKMAASGAGAGSGSRTADVSMTADLDQKAKANGFSCYKEMTEMSQCSTLEQFQEHSKRWKKK